MLKKIKEQEMVLLERNRIVYEADNEGNPTPSREKLKEEIAKLNSVDVSLVGIRHIFTKFGSSKFKLIAHIYKDANSLIALETPKGKKAKTEVKPST